QFQQRSHLACPLPPRASPRRAAEARLCGMVCWLPGPVAPRTTSSPNIARCNPFPPRARSGCAARGQQRRYLLGQIPLAGGWRAQPQAAPGVRLLAAQIGRLDHLRVAPDGVLLAEVEVVVGDFLERLVLGRLVPDHLEPRLLEGG